MGLLATEAARTRDYPVILATTMMAAVLVILIDDLPMTALFPDYEMHVVHRRIAGLSSPFRSVPLRHLEELWLEDEGGGER
jgi:hypothetical protein